MAKKVGIIRCDAYSEDCAGFNCFPAIRNKTGHFQEYDEVVELVGFDTCGGCGRGKPDKIASRVQRLKDRGAEVIHLGNCLISACPSTEIYIQALQDNVGIDVVLGTH